MILTILLMILVKYLPSDVHAINATVSPSTYSTPPGPPPGDTIGDFYGAHREAKNNTTITNFIDTYGISSWRPDLAYYGLRYSYVYVNPEKNYSKKLVFLNYRPDQTGINNSIIWVKLIDINEELPKLNDSEARAPGIIGNATQATNIDADDIDAPGTPGFTSGAGIAAIVLLLSIIKRKFS